MQRTFKKLAEKPGARRKDLGAVRTGATSSGSYQCAACRSSSTTSGSRGCWSASTTSARGDLKKKDTDMALPFCLKQSRIIATNGDNTYMQRAGSLTQLLIGKVTGTHCLWAWFETRRSGTSYETCSSCPDRTFWALPSATRVARRMCNLLEFSTELLTDMQIIIYIVLCDRGLLPIFVFPSWDKCEDKRQL